ncbi:hypothetical protein OF83DRAFT_841837 [Amylostereum chailletii]|nr:hypothetical protein OF83DRAFT_841837 [Amylostereum chailletii]
MDHRTRRNKVSVPPQIQLDFPSFPLLSSSTSETAFSPDILKCLPSSADTKYKPGSTTMPPLASASMSSSLSSSSTASTVTNARISAYSRARNRTNHSFGIPQIMITCPTSTSYAESDHDPLHSYAQPHSSFSSEEDFDTARGLDFSVDAALSMKTKVSPTRSTSSRTIASIVEQLERADCHFTDEVRRVQNDIDNARAEVRAWREARRLRELERIEKIERDT